MPIIRQTNSPTRFSKKELLGNVTKYWGVYIGIVKDNEDIQRTGRLRVWVPEFGSLPDDKNSWKTVVYCSPFAGVTQSEKITPDFANFDATQTSYGWWGIPPDLDNQVAVMFINGDPHRGIWFGCFYEHFMNHMVPGIASETNTYGKVATPTDASAVPAGKNVPVAEYNKKMPGKVSLSNVTRPVNNPYTEAIAAQGLINDNIRGTNTSSARREAPSRVYGLLTPGPRNPNSKGNRLGGNQFVLDDGDGSEYIGLRTRSGAYIRIDETNGLIYIINKKGTAWLQLDEAGNVDCFSAKSISMRAMEDVNLRADRDFNIEAGRNINIKAARQPSGGDINIEAKGSLNVISEKISKMKFFDNLEITVTKDNKLTVSGNQDIIVSGNQATAVSGTYDLYSVGSMKATSLADYHLNTLSIAAQSSSDITINGAAALVMSSGVSASLNGGQSLILSAASMSINGVPAPIAPPSTVSSQTSNKAAEPSEIPTQNKTNILATFSDLFTRNKSKISTIVKRMMTYEPCPEHINKGSTKAKTSTARQTPVVKKVETPKGAKIHTEIDSNGVATVTHIDPPQVTNTQTQSTGTASQTQTTSSQTPTDAQLEKFYTDFYAYAKDDFAKTRKFSIVNNKGVEEIKTFEEMIAYSEDKTGVNHKEFIKGMAQENMSQDEALAQLYRWMLDAWKM